MFNSAQTNKEGTKENEYYLYMTEMPCFSVCAYLTENIHAIVYRPEGKGVTSTGNDKKEGS